MRKHTTALALTGAVALASGAYALGTQAGDGSAAAGTAANGPAASHALALAPGPPGGPGLPLGFEDLADRLGVDEDELRDALEDIAAERRTGFAVRLAAALGIDRAKVERALENTRPDGRPKPCAGRPEALGAALAKELGVTKAQLEAAFEKLRGQHDDPRGEFARELADRLNLDVGQVQDALGDLHPPHFERHHP